MATKTPKYEFQKKEDNDFYNIEDFNANWDKVENALTEFDDSGTVEGITSFTDMLTKLVTGNKFAVTLRNLKAGLQFVLHAGSIVNNCVTDNAKLPLSAAQGKALQDAITKLNGDVELWNGTLSSGQSLTVPGISKYRAIYATIQGYKRVMFLSDTQAGFCGASAQGAQLSMSRLDISGDTVTFSGMTINFNPDGSVSNTVIPECTRISGYLTKITIS